MPFARTLAGCMTLPWRGRLPFVGPATCPAYLGISPSHKEATCVYVGGFIACMLPAKWAALRWPTFTLSDIPT